MEKTLLLRKIEVRRRRGRQNVRHLVGIMDTTDMILSKLQGMVRFTSAVHGIAESDAT